AELIRSPLADVAGDSIRAAQGSGSEAGCGLQGRVTHGIRNLMSGAQGHFGRDVYKRRSELSIHAGTQLPTVKMIAGLETVDGSHGAVEEIVQESHTTASSNRNKIAALPDH